MTGPGNTPTWRITEVRGRSGLRSLEADWRRIYSRMPGRTSFISFEACASYVDFFLENPDEVRGLVLDDGRETQAICLLEPKTERRLGFPVPVWRVLFMNKQCHFADLICADPEARRACAPLLVEHLRRHPEGRWFLGLGPQETDAELWAGLGSLPSCEQSIDQSECMRVVDCRVSFAQVEAGFSRNFRHSLRAARKRLAAVPDAQFKVFRGPAALAAELPVFLELESSGWKGEEQSSVRLRPHLADHFLRLATTLNGAQDYCEIVALYAGDRCIASAFLARTGPTCCGLKIGYDEGYGRVSPGQLVVAHIIERCCADPGIDRINLLSETPWMQGWPSELVDVQVVFVNIRGLAGRALTALLRLRMGYLRQLARRIGIRTLWPAPSAGRSA